MDLSYDREQTARAYDEYGEQEWDRHERAPFHRVAFHLHRHYLTEFVHRGDRVLEAGAASGRFTVELARLGATVVVTDISPGQLELNVVEPRRGGAGVRRRGSRARRHRRPVGVRRRRVRCGRLLRRTAQPRHGPRGSGARRTAPRHQAGRPRAARGDVVARFAPRVPRRRRRRDPGVRDRRDAGDLRDAATCRRTTPASGRPRTCSAGTSFARSWSGTTATWSSPPPRTSSRSATTRSANGGSTTRRCGNGSWGGRSPAARSRVRSTPERTSSP